MNSPPGRHVIAGRYRVLGEIGRGAMGRVLRVEHVYTGQPLALKVLLANRLADPALVDRFKREARAPMLINSDHVVRVVDADFAADLDGVPYIAMELLDGMDLSQYLRARGCLSPVEVVEIVGQMARALEKAHSIGIAHRDLKPGNVFLHRGERGPIVKLLDFGLLKAWSNAGPLFQDGEATIDGMVVGTPLYMAPEQAQGKIEQIGQASDIWAVGQIVYRLLTGGHYWSKGPFQSVLAQILAGVREAPTARGPRLPPAFDDWFMRSCQSRPSERWPSAQAQSSILADVLTPGSRAVGPDTAGARAIAGALHTLSVASASDANQRLIDRDGGSETTRSSLAETVAPTLRPILPSPDADPAAYETRSETGLRYNEGTGAGRRGAMTDERTRNEGERRQVTVLAFSLLLGQSETEIDPEHFQALAREFRDTCGEVLGSQGEHAMLFRGVAHHVYFGYPIAYGDDARRAVAAALGIIEATARLDRRKRAEQGPQASPLAVRVGVHTGLVVAREIDGDRDGGVVGAALGVATRLEQLSRPGVVTLSTATHRLVRGQFDCRKIDWSQRGDRSFESVTPPIAAYEIDPASPSVGASDGLRPHVSLVGREAELRLILDRSEQVATEGGHVVLVSGDAGIGKSHILQAVRQSIGRDAIRWLECQCSPYFANTAFYPIRSLIGEMASLRAELTSGERFARLEELTRSLALPAGALPLLASLLAIPVVGAQAPLNVTPQRQKQLTEEVLLALFEAVARQGPTCFVIEDLHWVDPSTLELLNALVDGAPGAGLFMLLTFRPDFRVPWNARSSVTQVNLPRLSRSRVETLIGKLAGDRSIPDQVIEQLVARSDGVPLFVEELTAMVMEAELAEGEVLARNIPSSLRESLTTRLDRLGSARSTAQLASVLGREFDRDLLVTISRRDQAAVQADLDRLASCELIFRRGLGPLRATGDGDDRSSGSYAFKHSLVQEAAYESLLQESRKHAHAAVAGALTSRLERGGVVAPEVIAHHFAAAEQTPAACGYLIQAATNALKESAMAEASHHLGRGLALVETLPDGPVRAQLELPLRALAGVPLMATSGYGAPAVERTYARALELAEQARLTQSPELFPVLWGLWIFHLVRVRYGTALELAGKLMSLAEGIGDPAIRLCAHVALGNTRVLRGDLVGAREDLEQGIRLYDPAAHFPLAYVCGQDPGVQARSMLSWTLWLLGKPDAARHCSEEAVAIARRCSHPSTLGFALAMAMGFYEFRGEPEAAERASSELIALAREQGLIHWMGAAILTHGWAAHELGDRALGIEEMRQGRAMFEQVGALCAMGFHDSLLVEALAAAGERAECAQRLGRALPVVREEERVFEPEILRAQGIVALRLDGDREAARRHFEAGRQAAVRNGSRAFELRAVLALAQLARDAGDQAGARALVAPVYAGFTEGLETRDLRQAREFLANTAN